MVTRFKQFNSLIVTRLGTSSSYKVVRIVVGNLRWKQGTLSKERLLKERSSEEIILKISHVLNLRDNPLK